MGPVLIVTAKAETDASKETAISNRLIAEDTAMEENFKKELQAQTSEWLLNNWFSSYLM
jgi:hypothetical protein